MKMEKQNMKVIECIKRNPKREVYSNKYIYQEKEDLK